MILLTRRLTVLLVAAVLLILVAACGGDEAPPGAQAPAEPRPVVWSIAENLHRDPTTIDRKIAIMKGMGVEMVRLDLGLEPIDVHAVRSARRAGLAVMGVVVGPREPQAYADWIEGIVRRYAPLGVHHYELWNEPNLRQTWPTADDPAVAVPEYMALVRAAYPRVKQIDPQSVVLVGALSRREDVDAAPNDWVRQMYDNGLSGNFDALSVHPYTDPEIPGETTSPAYSWLQMAGPTVDGEPSMRDLMVRNGDGGKTIWITEFGAPTGGPLGNAVDEDRQAVILREGMRLAQSYPWIGGFFWYGLRDQPSGSEAFGLLDAEFSPKPAYDVFVRQVRATRGRAAGR